MALWEEFKEGMIIGDLVLLSDGKRGSNKVKVECVVCSKQKSANIYHLRSKIGITHLKSHNGKTTRNLIGDYICIWHNGKLERFSDVKDFAYQNGMDVKHILSCLLGDRISYRYCRFVENIPNINYIPQIVHYYIATEWTGLELGFVNVQEFASIYDLYEPAISACICGNTPSYHGWKFKEISREEFELNTKVFKWLEEELDYKHFCP